MVSDTEPGTGGRPWPPEDTSGGAAAASRSPRLEPYRGFEGTIGPTVARSTPDWPAENLGRADAPNVVVMLCDDLGFGDLGCYGSEIETPNLDRLATEGLRYTNFHVMPMCSPTRAALLTGVNSHRVGVGHVAHSDPGYPGYAMELSDDAATIAETLGAEGWSTLMVGKWHLSKDVHLSEAGPRHSWPCQKGFDRFYGILDGFTNFHQPHRLYEDNHALDIDAYPDGYYFTDDLTDRAITMIRSTKASDPTRPFFLYFAHGAVHAPLQAKPTDIEKYRGAYEDGWDEVRAARFARQLDLGIVAPETPLPPRNAEPGADVRAWSELSDGERELFARYMEIYAAMVDSIDQNLGRLRGALEAIGEWDNTIFVFTSDNGASREGEEAGTSAYFRTLMATARDTEDATGEDHARLDLLGGPQTLAHYPRGWAMASNTPFRLYKQNTHAGGHSVPLIIAGPGIAAEGYGGVRSQYQHVTDIVPTLLEQVGVDPPSERAGRPLHELDGSTMVPTFADAAAPATHVEQYYEQWGNKGFYRDGWEVVTYREPKTPLRDNPWELYHLADDPTETVELAADHPERVAELAQAWEEAAWANQVFPIDEGSGLKFIQRPPWFDRLAEPVTIDPGTPQLERMRSLQLIDSRNFTVTIRVAHHLGAHGALVAHGDQGGGYGVYVVDDELRFVHNGYGLLRSLGAGLLVAGEREIRLEVTAPGGARWDVRVLVDGDEVARGDGYRQLFGMAPFQGIDVGVDRCSPVSWELHERFGSCRYPGAIHSVTYTPGESAPDAGRLWLAVVRQMGERYD